MRVRLALAVVLTLSAAGFAQSPKPLASPKTEVKATPEAKASPVASPSPDPKASPATSPSPAGGGKGEVATPQPIVVVVQNKEPEAKSDGGNLIAGWIGLGLLVVGGVFGVRYLKNRGLTVTGAFKQLGVELPQEAPPAAAPVSKPAVAPLPPLPSLSDLPAAGAAPAGVAVVGSAPTAGPLPAPTGQPKLVGYSGPAAGKVIPLMEALTVGREPDNTLALPSDTTVSRKHAVFLPVPGGWELSDSGSSNGTFVNGNRLAAPQVLSHGDEIKIGASRLRYEA